MDENVTGIYDDLMNTDLGTEIYNLQKRNDNLTKNIETLANHVKALTSEVRRLKKSQENVSRNISELFNTAKAEIARKDRMIADLQQQLDTMILQGTYHMEARKRTVEDDTDTLSRYSDNSVKRPKYNGKPDNRHDGFRAFSSDDCRYKMDFKRDKPREYRSRSKYRDSTSRSRDSRSRDSSRNRRRYNTNYYRDDYENIEDQQRNYSNYDNQLENRNYRVYKPRPCSNIEVDSTENERIAVTGQNEKREINILESEEVPTNIPDSTDTSGLKENSNNNVVTESIEYQPYVKLEKSFTTDMDNGDTQKKIDKVEEVVHKQEDVKTLTNTTNVDKSNISKDIPIEVLSNSSQEFQNAVNIGMKNESLRTNINESITPTKETSFPNTDNNLTNDNNTKTTDTTNNIGMTSSNNKSFRNRRRRCVITVDE